MRKRKGIVEELSQRDGIGRSFPHRVMLSGFMPTASGLPLPQGGGGGGGGGVEAAQAEPVAQVLAAQARGAAGSSSE